MTSTDARASVPQIVTVSDSAAPESGGLTLPEGAELERLRGGLRIIALRALGDPDAAEEAVQETLSRAVVALAEGRLADATKLTAYVAGIARHVCLHWLRDRKDTVPLDASETIGHPQLQTHANALEQLISAAESDRLRAAFRKLPTSDQQLLQLCFHEDQTPAEVAATLGEPADRIRKRKERALDRLRRAFLGDERHDEPASGTDNMAPLMPTDKSRSDNG